jgi:hypothetical protein
MTTPSAPLGKDADVRIRIERAKKHIVDLNVVISAFYATYPYEIIANRDPNTRKPVYQLGRVNPMSGDLSAIAGDALQNLRGALDHLAWLLVLANNRSPDERTYFPISEDFPKHMAKQSGVVQNFGSAAAQIWDGVKPYKGGNDDLWLLNKLNNIQKHRPLLTVGAAYRAADIGPIISASLEAAFRQIPSDKLPAGFKIPAINLNLKPADRMCPLKAGDVLFTDTPDAEIHKNMKFTFEVAFGEAQVAEGDPVLETLHKLVQLVDGIVTQFATLL